MKILENIVSAILGIFIWMIIAFLGYLGTLLLFQAILGPDSGGRGEVLRSLYAIGVAGVLSIGEIILLFKWKEYCAAISVLIIFILFGGYFLLLNIGFGYEYLFPEHQKNMAKKRQQVLEERAFLSN